MATRKAATSSKSSVLSDSRALNANDILNGGGRSYRTVEIPELSKDGAPGILYYKPISARLVLEFSKVNADDSNTSQIEQVITRLGSSLVNPDGSPMFTVEQLYEVPVDTLLLIFNAITSGVRNATSGEGSTGGNASSGGQDLAPSSATSIA